MADLKSQGFSAINKKPIHHKKKKQNQEWQFQQNNQSRQLQQTNQPRTIQQFQQTNQSAPEQPTQKQDLKPIEWTAKLHSNGPKSPDWYWSVGVISVAIFAAAVMLGDVLFGVFILLAGFAIALYAAKKPEPISFKADFRGIKIKNQIYDYESLKCFWIEYDPPHQKDLFIESTKMFMPIVIIPLGDADPSELRKFLLKFIPERKIEEPTLNVIGKMLGI